MKPKIFVRYIISALVIVPLLLSFLPLGALTAAAPSSSTSPQAMPPHPDLLAELEAEGEELPDLITDPALKASLGIDQPGPLKGPSGTFNAIALLVNFSDNAATTGAAFFDSLIFAAPPATSVRDYWDEVSYATLDIVTVDLPSTTGWYLAPQTYAYYVAGVYGFGAYPQNAQRLVEDVVALADGVVDFSQYDNDGDTFVDALMVVHAGTGAEFSGSVNDIWSHKWNTSAVVPVDGVNVYDYSMMPEFWAASGDMTIGVFCHELGHVFGLPDLYDRDGSSEGIGEWSLMASGSWNGTLGNSPAHLDAWCRDQLDFATPTVVTADILGAPISAVETSGVIYRLWTGGAIGPEYFLVENRQAIGYDSALPGFGLCIWHVDDNVVTQNDEECFNPNNWLCPNHYLVALEQADGLFNLELDVNRGDAGDPYPGSTTNRNFNSGTTPNSSSYNSIVDNATLVGVNNITDSAATMTADLLVGVSSGSLEYGDAPDDPANPSDYPSLFFSDGSRHSQSPDEWLGLGGDSKDYEPDANVPDADQLDDGLVTTSIFDSLGAETVTFEVTDNIAPSTLYVNILIDLNIDGDWADPGEHVVQNQVVTTTGPGTESLTVVSNPFSTVGATSGSTYLRITLSRIPIPPPWDGTMAFNGSVPFEFGETEDHLIDILESEELLEFGDAPDDPFNPSDYPSLLFSDGARHYQTATEWLGLAADSKDYEFDSVQAGDAFDDGLVTTTIAVGDPAATVDFEVTDTTADPAAPSTDLYVNILIDLNADGDWNDAGEHVVQNQALTLTNPAGEQVTSDSFSTVGATPGPTWLRLTLTKATVPVPWDGTMTFNGSVPFSFGETEDHQVGLYLEDLEYGDAPDPNFPSTLASDGARHAYTRTEWLGLQSAGDGKDEEPDADQPDLDGNDDGLVTTTITAGLLAETVTFEVTDLMAAAAQDLYVNILIDLNGDGDWSTDDFGEHVVVNQYIAAGGGEQTVVSNPFITVGATPGPTWLRITLTRSELDTTNPWDGTMAGYAAMTPFAYGETEDHLITMNPAEVTPPGVTICTPPVFELTLRPGESATEIKVVELATMPIPEVDIVFAFDLTGSMDWVIDEAKAQAINIMAALSALIPDARFAVMSYMDYPEYYDYCGYAATYGDPTSGDYAYRLDQALTADTAAVAAAITGLVLGFGSDSPEDYTRIMYESYAELIGQTNPTYGPLGYRPGAKKILINFADDIPHDCAVNEGVPGETSPWTSTGGDPGRDEIMGNADDLDLQTVLAAMATNEVTLLEVHCSSANLAWWAYWAGLTGGAVFEVTDPSGIAGAVYALVEAEVSLIELLTLHVQPAEYAGWVTWIPQQYTNVSGGETKTFSIIYTVPDDVPSGDYVFEVKVIADGIIICRQIVTIHVIAEEVAPARIIVRNLLIQPANAYPGQQVTISADVVNQGGIRGSKNIELVINGQAEQAIRVGVDPGAAQHITFTTSKTVPGTYEVYIEGQASAFNVLLRPHVTSTGAFEGLGTGAVIAIVVIGVIFLVGIIIVFIRVRRPV